MNHTQFASKNLVINLQPWTYFEDQGQAKQSSALAQDGILSPQGGGNVSTRVRRRLASLASVDLEAALLRGLAWGNGRGLR